MRFLIGFILPLITTSGIVAGIYPIAVKKSPEFPKEGVNERWKEIRNKEALLYERLRPLKNYGSELERFRGLNLGAHLSSNPQQLTIRVLVIRVEFLYEDPDDPQTTGRGKMILTPNDEDSLIERNGCTTFNLYYDPPHDKKYFKHLMEFLSNYYYASTFGRVKVEFVIKPDGDTAAYQLPHTLGYYGDIETWPEGFFALMQDAIRAADEDSTIDFADLDGNGIPDNEEGVLDRYLIFHAGAAWQTDMGDTPLDLPAATILGYPYFGVVVDEGQDTVFDVSILPETMSQDGVEIKLQGTLVHEMGHEMFLFPDLYDVSGMGVGIGAFGLMGVGYYLGISDSIPEGLFVPLMNVWERNWTSWILDLIWGPGSGFINNLVQKKLSPTETSKYLSLWPSEILMDTLGNFIEDPYSHLRFLEVPINNHEYYLIEYKLDDLPQNDTLSCETESTYVEVEVKDGVVTSLFGEQDYLLPGKGLLIFHIDEDILWDHYSLNEVNAARPMAVDVEEADGVQDFEHWTDFSPYPYALFGNPYDLFFNGNKDEFSDTTSPDTRDNQGGHTWIKVFGISDAGPDSMSFFIMRGGQVEGFPLRLGYFSKTIYFLDHNIIVESLPMNGYLETYGNYIFFVQTVRKDSIYYHFSGEEALIASDTMAIVYLLNKSGEVLDRDTVFDDVVKSGPLFCDLDGDSIPEGVVGLRSGKLYLFKIFEDTLSLSAGFPVQLPDAIYATPSGFDIDGDGNREILVSDEDQKLYSINLEGHIIFGTSTGAPGRGTATFYKNIIYFLSADGRIFLLSKDGNKIDSLLPPYTALTTSSLAIGDVNGDSVNEIVATTAKGILWVLGEDGDTLVVKDFGFHDPGSPALGNVDDDPYLEIAFVADGNLFVINHLGSPLSGYPVKISDSLSIKDPILADINGDGRQEVLVAVEKEGIFAFDYQGKQIPGYPLSLEGKPDFTPRITKSGNGNLDLTVADSTGTLYLWRIHGGFSHWQGFGNDPIHSFQYFLPISSPPSSQNLELKRIYLYPNPALKSITRLRFKVTQSGEGTWELYSMRGFKLKEGSFTFRGGDFEEVDIDLKDIASGVYYIRTNFNGKITKILKLAVVK